MNKFLFIYKDGTSEEVDFRDPRLKTAPKGTYAYGFINSFWYLKTEKQEWKRVVCLEAIPSNHRLLVLMMY